MNKTNEVLRYLMNLSLIFIFNYENFQRFFDNLIKVFLKYFVIKCILHLISNFKNL